MHDGATGREFGISHDRFTPGNPYRRSL